jgi:histidinol-phosphate aminotransferase
VAAAQEQAVQLAVLRSEMVDALKKTGVRVVDGSAPFVLFEVPDAQLVRKRLSAKGIAVRRCDTFVGFDGQYLRAAVRPEWPTLVAALAENLP